MSPARVDMAQRLAAAELPDVDWLTTGALARLLRVDYETIRSGVDRGELPKPHRRLDVFRQHRDDRVASDRGVSLLSRNIARELFNVGELRAARRSHRRTSG